ncbi:MOP flippase family protein [Psychroflexus sp. CAK8W]|uniref:MOP flippase family protein n=1 Tax=Psychroflexus longus TaxID=2873596 RepID=A0ABS7XFI4_9FLAO|nr:MOP flippase family protein [Psychroflexus longus]MBZ9777720.1 MOP flippase family protein [Psychroflexus longus]
MKNSYKKEAVSGVKWTGLSSIFTAGGSFVLILVLTNILGKEDFGLFALVNIVVGFSAEFVDIGISQAIIQKQEINKKQLSTLYWVNIFLALLVFLVINASKGFIGDFYEEAELPKLLGLVSFSFLFSGLSAQYQALLQKELRFKLMASLDIIAFTVYLSVTLSMAYLGYGVYALVWGTLARTGVKSILLLITGLKAHIPRLYFNLKEVKYFLNFGSFRTGSFLVSFLNTQLDSILIGKFIGVGELGVYDVFKRIVQQPIRLLSPIIQKVTYPLMAKVHEDKLRVTQMFKKILELLNAIRIPILIGIALVAPEITRLFLGDEWSESYYVLQILALVFIFRTMQSFFGQAMLASGKAKWGFYNNLIMLPMNLITIYIGSYWGILGISVGILIQTIIIIFPIYTFIIKPLFDINLNQFLSLIFKDLAIILLGTLIILFTFQSLDLLDVFALILKAILFSIVFIGYILLFKKNIISYSKYLMSK